MGYDDAIELTKTALANKRATVEGKLVRVMCRPITSAEAAAGRKTAYVALLERLKVKHCGRWYEFGTGRAFIEKKRWRLGTHLQEGIDWLRFEAMIRPADTRIGCKFEEIQHVRLPYAKSHGRAWPKHGKTKIISKRAIK